MDSMLMTMLRNALMQVELMDERTTDVQDSRRAGRIAGIAAIAFFLHFLPQVHSKRNNSAQALDHKPRGGKQLKRRKRRP